MCREEDFGLSLDERLRHDEALRKPLPPEFIGTAQECYDEAMRRSLAGIQPHMLCEVVGPNDPRRTLASKETHG